MDFITNLLIKSLLQVWVTFTHNWPFLVVSVLIAVALKHFVDPNKVSAFLTRYRRAGVVGATLAAVGTPLCSCGTTAIVLGMMASMIPWAPVIAFMVASPLTSPEELIYSAGLFGWPFALAFFASSIVLGLLGGLVGDFFDKRGWLKNQTRFSNDPVSSHQPQQQAIPEAACSCSSEKQPVLPVRQSRPTRPQSVNFGSLSLTSLSPSGEGALNLTTCCEIEPAVVTSPCSCEVTSATKIAEHKSILQPQTPTCGCGSTPQPTIQTAESCACDPNPIDPAACPCQESQGQSTAPSVSWKLILADIWSTGKRLLLMFLGFAFIGYLLNNLIPAAWVAAVFGKGNVYSVPLAATLGLPLYINTEASLPLVRALIDGGMSQGAALAFLITGAGTSIGAVAGALTIARWRVIAIVIGTLWVGAVLMGYLYNFLLLTGSF